MKARVDQSICVGSQDCVHTCPKVFKMQDGKAKSYVSAVPQNAEGQCRSASEGCTVGAITIEE